MPEAAEIVELMKLPNDLLCVSNFSPEGTLVDLNQLALQ